MHWGITGNHWPSKAQDMINQLSFPMKTDGGRHVQLIIAPTKLFEELVMMLSHTGKLGQ